MAKNFSYLVREFLNPAETRKASFILAHVENSIHGSDKGIDCVIQIADCDKSITLDFFLGNKRARQESIAKIDLLSRVLTGFKKTLKAEARLIEQAEQNQKSKKR